MASVNVEVDLDQFDDDDLLDELAARVEHSPILVRRAQERINRLVFPKVSKTLLEAGCPESVCRQVADWEATPEATPQRLKEGKEWAA